MLIAFIAAGLWAAPPKDVQSGVRYGVVSKRLLTAAERSKFTDVQGLEIAVRLKLSNDNDYHIRYLANAGSIVPAGYRLFRERGTDSWQSTSRARGKEGAPGTEFSGVGYAWLEIPPHASVEFEAHDWVSHSQEHAFSTFVRDGKQTVEVTSDAYVPVAE